MPRCVVGRYMVNVAAHTPPEKFFKTAADKAARVAQQKAQLAKKREEGASLLWIES